MAILEGVWKFNDVLTAVETDIDQPLEFRIGSHTKDLSAAINRKTDGLQVVNADGSSSYVYEDSTEKWSLYYHFIYIENAQVVNEAFYLWFIANATKMIGASVVAITYNGDEIARLKNGQSATLHCAGDRAITDIVATYDSAGQISYNETETALKAGKIVTLTCAGKKMLADVCISVLPTAAAGLYDENDNLLASWDALVNTYGMDVAGDYNPTTTSANYYKTKTSSPYYVLTNYSELTTGTKLILGDDVTEIEWYAFCDCAGLTEIVFPASLTAVGYQAFYGCDNITTVYFASMNHYCTLGFKSGNNAVTNAENMYYFCSE